MTDVQDSTTGSEPSMEEILASIRRIIADENEEPEAEAAPTEETPQEEDVLELTQAIQEDGSVESIEAVPIEPEPVLEPAVEMVSEPEFTPEPAVTAPPPESVPVPEPAPVVEVNQPPAETIVSDDAASAASASLADLANKVEDERKASMTTSFIGNGSQTLEGMVMSLMKPMLKSWLDENLPPIVERIVQKEVERIARKDS